MNAFESESRDFFDNMFKAIAESNESKDETNYKSLSNGKEIPYAGWLYAKRKSDGKEFFVISGSVEGTLRVTDDGKEEILEFGTFDLFRKNTNEEDK